MMASASPAETVSGRDSAGLRIYCLAHNLGFIAPRTPRIKCESGGHELDHGFPHAEFWEYCCDCQHYWRLDAGNTLAEQECPACERKITKRFFCAECKVIAIESDSPARRKAYSISSRGTASPACPGCLVPPPAVSLEHECADFGAFVTSRSVCPFCDEPLEAPPSFPCSVSSYVASLRKPAVILQFDPGSNVLRESQAGDYILIEKVPGLALPIVIPKAAKLSSKQDYYNTYYELFNCDNPATGEVIVLSPAIVEKTEEGWQLREAGFIDIKPDPVAQSAVSAPQVGVPCAACGVPGKVEDAFCKRCGAPMLGQQRGAAIPPQPSPEVRPVSTHHSDAAIDQFTERLPVTGAEGLAPTKPASGTPWKGLLGVAAAIALVGIVVAIATLSKSGMLGGEPTVEVKLDRAMAAGNLFSPANDNAHDLYYTLKSSGANDKTLGSFREKLTPLLTTRGNQLTSDLMRIGYDEPEFTEWQEAAKHLDWAQELNPGNSSIAARAAYCRGRAAYLQKDLDEALRWWTSAGDLDKSWVLPVNGLGMVHTAKKNWDTARTYFFQALQRDANWPFPDENIGNTYLMERDYATAKEFYRKAIGKAPNWAKPHIHLADLAVLERDYATAVSEFEAALGSDAIGLKGKEPAVAQKALEKARQKLSEGQGY